MNRAPPPPAAAPPAPRPPEARTGSAGLHRRLLLLLAAVALAVTWLTMAQLSRRDPWYDRAEMNVHNMVDALAINSNVGPGRVDQPALPSKYLLALDYRVRHYLGALPVWNLKKFGDKADPLPEIPRLLQIGRQHSRMLVMLFALTAAGLVYTVTRRVEASLWATILLCGCSGLLYQGLVTRPDLLCSWFGLVLAPLCLWRASDSGTMTSRHVWLFVAGLGTGLAILTKLPGLCYLAASLAWCWLAPGPATGRIGQVRLPSFLLPIASSAALFWLLSRLTEVPDVLSPVALIRLRLAAALVGALPLLALWPGRDRSGAFLLQRGLDLALLGGGALAAVTLGYGALCAVMTPPGAAAYLARVVEFMAHPDPQMKYLLAANLRPGPEFLSFVGEAPFLFASAAAVTAVVVLTRTVPFRLKAFIVLLFIQALAMTWLLAHRHFLDQFSVYAQVPLLLLWPLSLFALGVWRPSAPATSGDHWAVPAAITGAAVLLATVYLRLEPKQRATRTEGAPPVSALTLTYLYNHDAHPVRYRDIMAEKYGTREQFAAALEKYLADPAHHR